MSAGRRLAAILAADVVGYSRLVGENQAGPAREVRQHREATNPISFIAYGGFTSDCYFHARNPE